MKEKLNKLFKESISELKSIGIDIDNKEKIGIIDIDFSKRKTKRYGCCKQENPDLKSAYRIKRKIYYKKFNNHHIEISKWLMELNDEIIKNTIIHELIHCLPDCNNHGVEFKKMAKLINEKLGYNITRLGNKKEDYIKSNALEKFDDEIKNNYKIICEKCNQTYYRQRLARNFTKKYLCGICRGRFIVQKLK